MIDNKMLQKLIIEFKAPREEFDGKSYLEHRKDWFEERMTPIRSILIKGSIDHLTIKDAELIYKKMTVGGPRLYLRTFISNGIDRIRKSLKYLLYGSETLEDRFYNFTSNPDSDYRLQGVSRAFASTALCVIDSKNFAIWNGAVDGGLDKLDVLPKKERGEHVGQTYIKISKVLEGLRDRCGFEDLNITDEFVELIFHEKIGSEILPPPSLPPPPDGPEGEEKDKNVHLRLQYMLIKIGLMRGYDVWVATNDLGKKYEGEKFSDLCLTEIPHFAGPEVLRIAKSIDVIWFKKHAAQPIWFFEIEHTSSIYSGLLRLNDVKIDYPIPKASIVSSKDRKNLFDVQIERRTFRFNELGEVCQFVDFKDVEKWYNCEKTIEEIKK